MMQVGCSADSEPTMPLEDPPSQDQPPSKDEPLAVERVQVTLSSSVLYAHGAFAQATVEVFGAGGAQLLDRTTVWSVSDPSVAIVGDDGTITTVSDGDVEIRATVEGVSGTAAFRVVTVEYHEVDPFLAQPIAGAAWEVPVVLISHLPTSDGINIDTIVARGFWSVDPISIEEAQARILWIAKLRKAAIEQGSRYRGYADPSAVPQIGFRVVEHITVYGMPPLGKVGQTGAGNPFFFADYNAVFDQFDMAGYVNEQGVKEIWWEWSGINGDFPSWDPAVHDSTMATGGWESNMSSPITGDVSNSDRDETDLPVYDRTYTVYSLSYRRTQAEAVHNVGHQVEALFTYVAEAQDGNSDLFWNQFVGKENGAHVVGRAGWTHMPPNTTVDYDVENSTLVQSDIEDWRPAGGGQTKLVNVDTWADIDFEWPQVPEFPQKRETHWYTYWMQSFPGAGNQIPHGDRWMTNWWAFVGDWDAAMASGLGLHGLTPGASSATEGRVIDHSRAFRAKDLTIWRDERRW